MAAIRRVDLTGHDAAQELVLADLAEGLAAQRRRLDDVQVELGDLRHPAARRQQASDDGDQESAVHSAHGISPASASDDIPSRRQPPPEPLAVLHTRRDSLRRK